MRLSAVIAVTCVAAGASAQNFASLISAAYSVIGGANGKPTASAKAALSSASSALSSLSSQATASSSAAVSSPTEPAVVASLTSELLRGGTAAPTGAAFSSDLSVLTSALAQPTLSSAIFANPSLSVLAEGVLRAASSTGGVSAAKATGSTGSAAGGGQGSGTTSSADRGRRRTAAATLATLGVVGGIATGVLVVL